MLINLPIHHTFYQSESLRNQTADVYRRAVRAIVLDGDSLLMVFSGVNQDCKFPGGGVESGECDIDALKRELIEECGHTILRVDQQFAVIREYDHARESGASVFMMESHYFFASVDSNHGSQRLDDYEKRLGFLPVWIPIREAIEQNTRLLDSDHPTPRWTTRETWVLRALDTHLRECRAHFG